MIGQCSIELLEAALAGTLPANDEASLYRHLEECQACGAALEQMAGGTTWSKEAASLLAGDELDEAMSVREEFSDADFTVEYLEPSDEPGVLGQLGGYDVLEILGRGGMSIVLKAFDRELKRCVAIKVLAPYLAHSSLAKKRFTREAQAAAAVVHPHVLAIHQVQAGGRLPFLVMPLVAGESLAQRLAASGTLELKEILRIGMQAAAGLAAAHDQGLVHRDVKPANILLEMGVERAVLTDFGLARAADDVSMTRSGIIAGTPQYMSPEQAKGEAIDGRSDLFSLGCVLYEMATGVSPFRSDSTIATLRRLVDEPPRAMASLNPELPPWFIAVVEKLLEKDPSRRFGSAKEVSELIEGCLAHIQQPATAALPATLPKPVLPSHFSRLKSRFKGAIVMFAALGMVLLGILGWQSLGPPDISGQWTGEDWGAVILKQTSPGEYTGSYTDTFGKKPGEIQLKWSRIERRFNGTWREGDDLFGELSVRLVNKEIRGALTTDAASRINPATPRLADLMWVRSSNAPGLRDSVKTDPVDAMSVTLRAEKDVWRSDETPWLRVDVRFGGTEKLTTSIDARLWRLEVDGVWYLSKEEVGPSVEFDATHPLNNLPVLIGSSWKTAHANEIGTEQFGGGGTWIPEDFKRRALNLLPGKHTIRLAVFAMPTQQGGKTVFSAVSKALEIETSPPRKAPTSEPQMMGPLEAPKHLHDFPVGEKGKLIAYSAAGKLIAIANGGPTLIVQPNGSGRLKKDMTPTVEILDAATGKTVASLLLTPNDEYLLLAIEGLNPVQVEALAFSPDGSAVAVGTSTGQVKLFNAKTSELILSLDDEKAKLAEKKTPKTLKALKRAMGSISSLAFSPDGSLLAVCGSSFDDNIAQNGGGVERTGRAATGPGRLKVWEAKTGTLKHDLIGNSDANMVAFSPDGSMLACAGSWLNDHDHGTGVIIWNPKTGMKIRTITREANGGTHAVAFSPNSKLVVIGSLHFDKDKDTSTTSVSLAHASTGILDWVQTIQGWASPKTFTPDGKRVAVLEGDAIRFFEAESGSPGNELGAPSARLGQKWRDFAITPNGHLLGIAGIDGEKGGVDSVWDYDLLASIWRK